MKISLAALLLSSALVAPAFAQSLPANVSFTTVADMPSLKDNSRKDTFTIGLSDSHVVSTIEMVCSAGRTEMFIMRSDKACAIAGTGSIVNPANGAKLPRTQYAGGYIVKADGATDAATMIVNYLAVGSVAPSSTTFTGELTLKPELTSTGAAALRDSVLKKINVNAGAQLIDQRVDTVDISRLFIPSAGFPSDVGCTWNGNLVFAYQTESWFIDLTGNCAGKDYVFKGNMPWTDSIGAENQTQYDLTLTLPSAALVGDDALFASASVGDLFATVDGITAQIIMKESAQVTVDIDGTPTQTPSKVDAAGTFTGTNVPLDVVRSMGLLFGLLSPNLFGA